MCAVVADVCFRGGTQQGSRPLQQLFFAVRTDVVWYDGVGMELGLIIFPHGSLTVYG